MGEYEQKRLRIVTQTVTVWISISPKILFQEQNKKMSELKAHAIDPEGSRSGIPSYTYFLKGGPDPSHFFYTNVGKSRIRHTTSLKLRVKFLDRLKIDWRFKIRVVLYRIRSLPILIPKKYRLGFELPLKFFF